ncbi:hypothetical protein [Aulosira sp. FACHB-615]|uniref:hypothetical protein n=1 Tax=Aulosira sp. FACHB-615 TaxID=2692777 RepID=UPI001688A97A|nr:hypothetical protein [Aulosira sp. FACHB-615]MBD2492709.1 hypothetical protein [Aulosira sp. FACHB-615]
MKFKKFNGCAKWQEISDLFVSLKSEALGTLKSSSRTICGKEVSIQVEPHRREPNWRRIWLAVNGSKVSEREILHLVENKIEDEEHVLDNRLEQQFNAFALEAGIALEVVAPEHFDDSEKTYFVVPRHPGTYHLDDGRIDCYIAINSTVDQYAFGDSPEEALCGLSTNPCKV